MQKKPKPFIHLFETPLGFYFYDVNTNDIVEVNKEMYEYLRNDYIAGEEINQEDLKNLKARGYLKTKRVEKTEHPATELLPFYAKTKMGQLILQVTQNCNLRCEYCVYSGNYETRGHTNKKMGFQTAKKAIDFLAEHSKNRNEVIIGFYGGEPLLEFSLMKQCVEYAEERLKGKKIEYSITTNATLLTDDVIKYFITNDFLVTVSLDGPREIQDECRKFLNDKGSFDTVMKNLKRIKERDREYFDRNVRVNTVLVVERGYECVDHFFKGNEIFSNLAISSAAVSDNFSKNKRSVSEKFHIEQQYELFKTFLAELGYLPSEDASLLMRPYLEQIYDMRGNSERSYREEVPSTWHRGGPCISGAMRLFVTAEGKLFPCERVCEISEYAQIGTLEEGLDLKKMSDILNIEKLTEKECRNCWAYSECNSCIRFCNGNRQEMKNALLSKCSEIRRSIEGILKDFTILQELGYDFEAEGR